MARARPRCSTWSPATSPPMPVRCGCSGRSSWACPRSNACISALRAPIRSSRCFRASGSFTTWCSPCLGSTGNRDLYANAHASLERVGLGEAAERIVVETSYGERRRLELAMALAQKPKLLLLDEPLAGLSQGERQTVRALLDAIPRDVTIVMIEHDMDTALAFAERITVLHYGEVIVEGTRAEVVADPRTREVYLGD